MNKQLEMGGLVITKAYYGNQKAVQRMREGRELDDDLASQVLDVTIPLNFLVNDSGQLKVCIHSISIMLCNQLSFLVEVQPLI